VLVEMLIIYKNTHKRGETPVMYILDEMLFPFEVLEVILKKS